MHTPRDWQAIAFNTSPDSDNRIHSDEMARGYGFKGGLVPGVVVSAYLIHPGVQAWGMEWLTRGHSKVVIHKPTYDGDSFHVEAPHGREEIRLYYVDAPESAARTYRDGNTNHLRIAQQGAAMGGLDQRETIKVGVDAKAFVKQLLDGKRFKVVTRSERVYGSHRKYAFVIVDWKGQRHYLHELLVLNGLARIHTKPAHLPDNTTASDQKKRLYELQSYAKDMRYGAWGL